MRRDSGFTAIEVAVTLAIVAILASLTMPSFLGWLNGHRLRGSAINLMADIERAKIKAIRESSFVTIQLEAGRYFVFLDDGSGGGVAGDLIRNGAEGLIQDRYLPSGVQIVLSELTLADNRMRFNSRGQAPDLAVPEFIPLVSSAGRKDVRVNRLGNVRVQ